MPRTALRSLMPPRSRLTASSVCLAALCSLRLQGQAAAPGVEGRGDGALAGGCSGVHAGHAAARPLLRCGLGVGVWGLWFRRRRLPNLVVCLPACLPA